MKTCDYIFLRRLAMPNSDANLSTSTTIPATTTTAATPATSNLGRCPLCGAPLQNPDECSMCDWVKGYDEPETRRINPRDPTAAILSIMWPCIGHYYKAYTQ